MKSREKVLHYGIFLFVLINVIIGLSGYVHAAPSQNKDPSISVTDSGGIQLDVKHKIPRAGGEASRSAGTEDIGEPPAATAEQHSDRKSKAPPDDDASEEEELERAMWTKLEADTDESAFSKSTDTADFGPPMDGGLSSMVCLVKWRNTDNLINAKDESVGWYDTLGTVISDLAIVAVPSAKLRSSPNGSTSDWYVKSVLVSLHESSTRKRLGKADIRTVYHPKFRPSRDSSHRIALVLLNSPLGDASGMKMAELVANPLVPRLEDSAKDMYDDYAVTACTMVVFTIDSVSKKFTVAGIPVVITKCVWHEGATGNAAYEDKVCVHLKIPYVPMEMLSDRMFYPNDVGSPLFCNGLLSGVYSGVQNLKGTRNGDEHLNVGTDLEVMYSGRLIAPDEQYVFEVPGRSSNWKFISGFTDQTERLKWTSTMQVLQDEQCHAQADLGPQEDMTEPPPPEDVTEEEDNKPKKKAAKKGRSSRNKDKNGAPPAAAAATLLLLLLPALGVVVG